MNVHALAIKTNGVPARWQPRLMLLFIVACFVVPLATAWGLVGRWMPGGTVQHGELLNPARPLTAAALYVTLDDGSWMERRCAVIGR